ncbi:hypothetical protein Tco_1325219 [Tanacetum coccineum]
MSPGITHVSKSRSGSSLGDKKVIKKTTTTHAILTAANPPPPPAPPPQNPPPRPPPLTTEPTTTHHRHSHEHTQRHPKTQFGWQESGHDASPPGDLEPQGVAVVPPFLAPSGAEAEGGGRGNDWDPV